MTASWVCLLLTAYAADKAAVVQLRGEPEPRAPLPEPKEKVKFVSGEGTQAIDTLLQRFQKANGAVKMAQRDGAVKIALAQTEDDKIEPIIRESTRGLSPDVLKDDSTKDDLFSGDTITGLLHKKYALPYQTTADVDFNGTYDQSLEWNGMYRSDFPSISQQDRKSKSASGQLDGIASTLAKNVLDLGDEDVTPYYVDVAPKNKYLFGTRHYLKKKEVVKMFTWVTQQLDGVREHIVDHFAASDPMLYKLANYIDTVNRAQTEMNERLAGMIEDAAQTLSHAKIMVNDRVVNAKDALPNRTDRVWVEQEKSDVKKFNTTALREFGNVELGLNRNLKDISGRLGKFGSFYTMYERSTQEALAKWTRTYRSQVDGVFTRLEQQNEYVNNDLSTFNHNFRLDEMHQQLDWFKHFMHSFRTVQTRSAFLNAATRLMTNSVTKMRKNLDLSEEVFNDRLDSWKKNQNRIIKAFDVDTGAFAKSAARDASKTISGGGGDARRNSVRALALLRARSKLEIAHVAQEAVDTIDSHTLFVHSMDTKRAMQSNISASMRLLRDLPNIDRLRRQIDVWPDIATQFQEYLTKDMFQPALSAMSTTIRSSRKGWSATASSDRQTQLSSVSAMSEEVNDQIRNVSSMIVNAWSQSALMKASAKLNEAKDVFEGTTFENPNIDQMWDALRAAESGLNELQEKGAQLENSLVQLKNVPNKLQKPSQDGSLVEKRGHQMLEEWNGLAKTNMALLQSRLEEVVLPHLPPQQPLSLVDVTPSSNIVPMYEHLKDTSETFKKAPGALVETEKGLATMLQNSTMSAINRATDDFMSFVKHATSIDKLPQEIDAAQKWVTQARMKLPNAATASGLGETEAALERLEKAYDPAKAAEDNVQQSVSEGVDALQRGLVLTDRTIYTRDLNNADQLNKLAKQVHGWADNLPRIKPLTGLLSPRDIEIPAPEVKLPSLEELGLSLASTQKVDAEVTAAHDANHIAHAASVSALLDLGREAHILKDASLDGEVVLEDAALTGTGKADLPVPSRRTSVLTAISSLSDSITGATHALKNMHPEKTLRDATPNVQLADLYNFPDVSKGDAALKKLKAASSTQSLSNAAASQEEELDHVEQKLRPILNSDVVNEIKEEAAQPAIESSDLSALSGQTDTVTTQLQSRIQGLYKETLRNLADKEEQSLANGGHLEDALSRQGQSMHSSVEAMLNRANKLESTMTELSTEEADEDKMDSEIRSQLEGALDRIPTIKDGGAVAP